MHFLPDTDNADAIAERYWPDSFKQAVSDEIRSAVRRNLNEKSLRRVYQRHYAQKYGLPEFADRVADVVTIGAENGADEGFGRVYQALMAELALPEVRQYARHLWPHIFSKKLKYRLHAAVFNDYYQDEDLRYAYRVGYVAAYQTFDDFANAVAWLVVAGFENGVDDMLVRLYKAFIRGSVLPPARRNPKRLKVWGPSSDRVEV